MTPNQCVAAVTGGGSGIGRATSIMLGGRGASVAVLDINLSAAEGTVAEIVAHGGVARAIHLDVADEASIDYAAREIEASIGPPSILVNNVGWDVVEPFVDNRRDFIRKVVAVNYLGPVMLTQVVARQMIDQGLAGRIVNIASDAARVGSLGETVYAGAKAGMVGFTKSLARELAARRITVNCVCPGPTDTPLFRAQPVKIQEALERAIPLRRLAEPVDIAGAVEYFVSDSASFVTGQVLSVSGGLTMAG